MSTFSVSYFKASVAVELYGMVEQSKDITRKLLDLMQETGYPIVQSNGQRQYGPPPDWKRTPPQKGCEVFIGKLPREVYEDELVPLFSKVGKIYILRLMMDFSGSNRGYAFVTYATKQEAYRAVKELNGYEIRPSRNIGVVKSVDNCRLFVGNIPKTKTKEEVQEELSKKVSGIMKVILYSNCYDRSQNRGFAFVEFTSHRAAAMARRTLVPGCVKLWDHNINIDWAEPEPDVDDEHMKKVKVLYVRNLLIKTSAETIKSVFSTAIGHDLGRVKKMCDYAFVHFHKREHAELAMKRLQNSIIDGSEIEIRWAKPVDRELYRIQKLTRGNAKFNNAINMTQTMMLYQQHLDKREYANSSKEDEGLGSGCAESSCGSPSDVQTSDCYALSAAKLDSLCKRYMWSAPVYEYQCTTSEGVEVWVCRVFLPCVGVPLCAPRAIGPVLSNPAYSKHHAMAEAAEIALKVIQSLKYSMEASSPTPLQPLYPGLVSPLVGYGGMHYDFLTPVCPQLPMHGIW